MAPQIVAYLPARHSARCAVHDPSPGWCDCGAVQEPLVKLKDAARAVEQAKHDATSAAQGDVLDTERLDWLALAGPVQICLVIDREHDGEIEVSTDDATGYGRTLRDAIDAARTAQEGK